MIRGIEGRNIVDDDRNRRDFVRRLGEVARASGTTVFAWALMSNHAHILRAANGDGSSGSSCEACKMKGVSLTELRSGSRRGGLPTTRAELVCELVEDFGVAAAEVARQVGISTSGVSKILSRRLSS